jgi:hypothetical protein
MICCNVVISTTIAAAALYLLGYSSVVFMVRRLGLAASELVGCCYCVPFWRSKFGRNTTMGGYLGAEVLFLHTL